MSHSPSPWSCAAVVGKLPWFVGSDLEAVDSEAVRLHLLDCTACRRFAAALQQSTRALRSLGTAAVAQVDDGMFAAMHSSILQAVQGAAARAEVVARRSFWWRVIPIAAAGTLFLSGWWFVQAAPLDVFHRPAIGTPVDDQGEVLVVPHSGPRVTLQPLGFESAMPRAPASVVGPGMMGRGCLRPLVDDGNPLFPAGPDGR